MLSWVFESLHRSFQSLSTPILSSLGNELNEEVCHGFVFGNLFNSIYLWVRLWWSIPVPNLVTNFQDLITKVKNLVTLVPVLGVISYPETPSVAQQQFSNSSITPQFTLIHVPSVIFWDLPVFLSKNRDSSRQQCLYSYFFVVSKDLLNKQILTSTE